MSSKKVASKAPAKAAAPAKKTAKSAAKSSAEQSKAKAVKKVEKKAEPEKKSKAKAPEVKKAPAKATKAAPVVKASPKKAAKPAPAPAKKVVENKAKAAPAKAAPVKVASVKAAPAKPAPAAKAVPAKAVKAAPAKAAPVAEKKETPKAATKAAETKKESVAKKPAPVAEAPAMKKEEPVVEVSKKQVSEKSDKKSSTVIKGEAPSFSILLPEGKKLCKYVMFFEIDEQEERANKKKVSSEMKNLEKKPTSAIRHKISLAEETQEELTERILKELEEQNLAFTREAATQICTRCNKNLVSPEFWVDKHLGYCEECAAILKLGQSKEARKVEYQLGAMGGDSLSEADDEDFGDGPDAADLKETEEELAEFDD